jgi:hypothetical protein
MGASIVAEVSKNSTRQVIYKYKFNVEDEIELELPVGAQFLTVQAQSEVDVCMWFQITMDTILSEKRKFYIIATGQPFNPTRAQYMGTFQLLTGAFVGHLYERIQ